MYGDVVLGLKPESKDDEDPFEVALSAKKAARGVAHDNELDADALRELVGEFKALVQKRPGVAFPDDPQEQLWGAIGAVFGSWMNPRAQTYRAIYKIPASWGTAVNVQSMVFGNSGDDCATGVAFTRDVAAGDPGSPGEYLPNAQGEDVVAGIRTPLQITKRAARAWAERNGMPEEERQSTRPPSRSACRSSTRARAARRASREALPRRAGHRVHDRARPAVDAPDARREADRHRRGADRARPAALRS
jgi:pyruvate,orthophosphate dikinase